MAGFLLLNEQEIGAKKRCFALSPCGLLAKAPLKLMIWKKAASETRWHKVIVANFSSSSQLKCASFAI